MAEEIKSQNDENVTPAADKTPAAPEKKKKNGKKITERVANFFKEYRSEMRKVVWYPAKDVVRDTGIVVVALAATGLVIGILDLAFSKIIIDLLGSIGG